MKIMYLCLLLLSTGCATSRVTYKRLSADEYVVTQKGQADVIVDINGKIEIKNPQSTIAGFCLEIKDIFKSLLGRIETTADINK